MPMRAKYAAQQCKIDRRITQYINIETAKDFVDVLYFCLLQTALL
ncbi:hypothetical protein Xmau_02972 [Xenorhabdus mauleonii]|uniref:Uncharacterized protein n=1 Tax=Xenorhabdus mauleonii TaxID=351675 RepID=A0A1I3T7T5_9GAMM|nr:hypothetical protein Xmau_02972 [Xenorhabdus mauleonii]SFJ66369.1 hypothetical protein SAMN05421680_11311 [Xenorhabdus mauleonii]